MLQNPRAYIVEQHQQTLSLIRSRMSCETQLVQFVHDIIGNLISAMNRRHKQTYLIILNFAKAFDKVPHRRLLHKLDYYGIKRVHPKVDQLMALRAQSTSSLRRSSLRSSPCFIRCIPGVRPRTDPFSNFYK